MQLLKEYGWNSVVLKYWKKLILFFLLPILTLNIIIYILNMNLLKQEINTNFKYSCLQTFNSINSIFEQVDILYKQFTAADEANDYILTAPEHLHTTSTINKLRENLFYSTLSQKYIDSIYIYSPLHNYVVTEKTGGYIDHFYDRKWYDYHLESGKTSFVISCPKTNTQDAGIYISYPFISDKDITGMMLFRISKKNIDTLIPNSLKNEFHSIYIVDDNNQILYSSDPNSSDILDESAFQKLVAEHFSFEYRNISVIFYKNPNSILEKTQYLSKIFLFCLVMVLILQLTMTLYISLQFYSSIHKIVFRLTTNEEVQETNLSKEEPKTQQTEIDFIIDHILMLTRNAKHFEDELATKIQALKKSQSLALQFQFNPHFLFNTLNMVNILIASYTKGPNDANRIIVLLSDLLTASMNSNDYILTLQEELEYEKKYIKILELQNNYSFNILWHIEDNTLSCPTLKLMLQPIIENIFQHALPYMPKNQTLTINIHSQIVNNQLFVSVSDNGMGVTTEKLQELRYKLSNDDIFVNKHIGLNNINQRIKLLFGEEYGLNVDSDEHGFTVTIQLPTS